MKKKRVFFIFIVIIILISTYGIYHYYQDKGIQVETAIVTKGDIHHYVEETGTVRSKEQREISINTSGEVSQLKFEIGDRVKEGEVVVTLDMDTAELEIKSLESKLNGLMPSYDQAVRNSKNSQQLYEQGAISYDAYQNDLAIEKELAYQISELKYNIKQLEEMKGFGEVKAPITGVITEIYIETGELATGGMPLMEIADLDQLFVEVELLTSEASQIEEGASAFILSEDLGINSEKAVIGKIHPKAYTKVSDLGIEQKRVIVEVETDFSHKLKLGYEVDVKILTASREDVLIIPDTSVFEVDDKNYVFKVDENVAVLTQIEIGLEGEDFVEVTQGLKESDRIIISPDEALEDQSKVSIMEINE